MSDFLTIHRLRVPCHIGVPDAERAVAQVLEISVSFKADAVSAAAASDDLHLTTNYFDVSERIKDIARARPRRLIETLAEDLATTLMQDFTLPSIEVEIRKFILPDAEAVSLSIKRKRKKMKPRKTAASDTHPESV